MKAFKVNQQSIESFFGRVNIIALYDHSGRAGNGFFLTIFDQHPEVLTCPWIHYIYSYSITEFGKEEKLDARRAHAFITQKSYFRYVFMDLDKELSAQMIRFGADPTADINREISRKVFDTLVLSNETITRKSLILSAYYAFAVGSGRNVDKIKYILVSDQVSLRFENALEGFSGKVINAVNKDFPQAKCISLVRDPRANFASCRHQFVNAYGNMYKIRHSNYFKQMRDLISQRLTWEEGCVYLFWLVYFTSAARLIYVLKRQYQKNFITIRNEDLNLKFIPTLRNICDWLNTYFWDEWTKPDYTPTCVGKPWTGTGAYNSQYQTALEGLLQNDPPDISRKVTGPNVYVTQRWKSRMGKNEIKLMEILFREEMADLSYDFLYYRDEKHERLRFVGNLILPFKGELPTLKWIKKGKNLGIKEVFQRLFYCVSFPPFYILSRIMFMKLYFDGFFDNLEIPLLDHDQNEEKTR